MPGSSIIKLMGIAVENAIVKIEGSKWVEKGPILITHWGLSGPAIIRLSAWAAIELYEANYRFNVIINWLGIPENEVREKWNGIRDKQGSASIPNRLWEYFIHSCAILPETKWSELASKEQNKLIHILTTNTLAVEGKTTFKEEFVTCGGISKTEIDPLTMESKIERNLFFGGEIIDVDGITGGFNFQHAWSSGYIAAKAIAARS
jgi:predicted Rossmann fold flavoprotein